MDVILSIFNNRELALITWTGIAFIVFLFNKAFRKFIVDASKTLFSKSFIRIYLLLFGYLGLILLGLYKINFWDLFLVKETLFWLIGVGFVLCIGSIGKDSSYFRKKIIDSLKITVIVEFLINLHVFIYAIEMIVLPILTFLIIFQTVADTDKKYSAVSKFLGNLLGFIGLLIISIALYRTIKNFQEDFTFRNLQCLLLPVILTFLFIPFSYLVAVYSAYESLFYRFYFHKKENRSKLRLKFEIIMFARLNLTKIHKLKPKLNLHDIDKAEKVSVYLRNLLYNPN